jgi:hypothetical protein
MQFITLSLQHTNLASTYRTIGSIQVEQQLYEEALLRFEKYFVIEMGSLLLEHPNIAYIFLLSC